MKMWSTKLQKGTCNLGTRNMKKVTLTSLIIQLLKALIKTQSGQQRERHRRREQTYWYKMEKGKGGWIKSLGGMWEGGSRWGTHVNPWLILVNVWQKPLQYCKVISLQLIKINGKKRDWNWHTHTHVHTHAHMYTHACTHTHVHTQWCTDATH